MSTESNTSGTNQLMQEGIRQVREGRTGDAYRTFREVITRDPGNEYAWIWISQTSTDRGERRMAIEKAFQINPDSQHARQALNRFNQEEQAAVQEPEKPLTPTSRLASISRPEPDPEETPEANLRSSLQMEEAEEAPVIKGRNKKPPKEKPLKRGAVITPTGQEDPLPPQKSGKGLRYALIALLAVLILGALALFKLQASSGPGEEQAQNPPVAASPASLESPGPGLPSQVPGIAGLVSTPVTETNTTTSNPATAVPPTPVSNPATTASAASPGIGASTAPATASTVAPAAPTSTAPSATIAPVTSSPAAVGSSPVAGTNSLPGSASKPDMVNQAQQLISAGDYKTAIGVLNEVVKNEPRNITAIYRLGSAFLAAPPEQLGNVDRYSEALKNLKRVTELAPTWSGGFARLGEALVAKGDIPAAITAISKSLELDPNGPERWLVLASLYDRTNQPAEANYARSRGQGLVTPSSNNNVVPTITPRR